MSRGPNLHRRETPLPRFGARRRLRARRDPPPLARRQPAPRPRWAAPAAARRDWGWPVGVGGSAVAHLLVVLLLLFGLPGGRETPQTAPNPSFDIVFEEQGERARSEADPTLGSEDAPPSRDEGLAPLPLPPGPLATLPPSPEPPSPPALPQPPVPPMPQVQPPPAPQTAEASPPPPVPPLPRPPEPPSAPRLAEAPPEPRPPTAPPRLPDPVLPELQAPPAFELVMPTPEPELAPQTELRLPERFALPLPPPSPPAPPRQQPQPPRQAQPQTPPSRPSIPGGIWMPEGTQLGQPAVPQRQGRPDGGRGLDTSVAPRFLEARPSTSNSLRVLSGNAPQDWQAGFQRWVRQNLHFPLDAAARSEDGPVTVLLDIGVDGRVRRVTMVRPSTSPSLNRMTTWPFIDAQLPPLPAAGNADGLRLEFTAQYVLIR